MNWAERLHQSVDKILESEKNEIDEKVIKLKESGWFEISKERSFLRDYYYEKHRSLVSVVSGNGLISYETPLIGKVKRQLFIEFRYLIDNIDIDYFFEKDYPTFWKEVVRNCEKELEARTVERGEESCIERIKMEMVLNRDEFFEYLAQIVASKKAWDYASNVLENDGIYISNEEKFHRQQRESLKNSTELAVGVEKIKWNGSGKELAELVLELCQKGYIDDLYVKEFCQLFETKQKYSSIKDYLFSTTDPKNGYKKDYERLYGSYHPRFENIKSPRKKRK
ncbi:MAG: hypothetical protein JXQ87_14010 [Bacteroidia bacterium]